MKLEGHCKMEGEVFTGITVRVALRGLRGQAFSEWQSAG
jgi:hypothetical protein